MRQRECFRCGARGEIWLHIETLPAVKRFIVSRFPWAKDGHTVIRYTFHYGDQKTGKAWGNTLTGYLSGSTGPRHRVPIVIFNKLARDGEALMDHCVVRIEYANKQNGGVLYQHPTFHRTEAEYLQLVVDALAKQVPVTL